MLQSPYNWVVYIIPYIYANNQGQLVINGMRLHQSQPRLGHDHLSIGHRGRPAAPGQVRIATRVMPRCSPSTTRRWILGCASRRHGLGKTPSARSNWCKGCFWKRNDFKMNYTIPVIKYVSIFMCIIDIYIYRERERNELDMCLP